MNARTAKFFVYLLRLPAVNQPQTETILSTYTWIFDLKLQYFLLIYIPPFSENFIVPQKTPITAQR
jgi:hypothetical protein